MRPAATLNGSTPMLESRGIAPIASFVCRKHEVSGHRSLERDVRGLLVADFSDEKHVRILTQHRSQYTGKRETLFLVHLHLVDAAQSVLDRVFHGDDVHGLSAACVERGVERRRLSGAGRPGHQQDSLLAH